MRRSLRSLRCRIDDKYAESVIMRSLAKITGQLKGKKAIGKLCRIASWEAVEVRAGRGAASAQGELGLELVAVAALPASRVLSACCQQASKGLPRCLLRRPRPSAACVVGPILWEASWRHR